MVLVGRHVAAAGGPSVLDDPDAELSAMGLDSMEMVGLIADLEASFDVEFPADMMVAETFTNVHTIADAVRSLRE